MVNIKHCMGLMEFFSNTWSFIELLKQDDTRSKCNIEATLVRLQMEQNDVFGQFERLRCHPAVPFPLTIESRRKESSGDDT